MKTTISIICLILACSISSAQPFQQRLDIAVKKLLSDAQMKHAIMSFYVMDNKTGKTVYDLNAQTGLAPASTQKIFTAIAALEMLGEKYRYKTEVGYDGKMNDSVLYGNLFIVGYGDPSFGSWRFTQTKRDTILNTILLSVRNAGIKKINGNIILDDSRFSYQPLPGGWIWDDIGNYYGAGTWAINWNENQYDLVLKPGKHEGENVEITGTNPEINYAIKNFLKTGKPGSGDNGYIYMSPYSTEGFVTGTEAATTGNYTISGSISYPAQQFADELFEKIVSDKIELSGKLIMKTKDIISGNRYFNDRKYISSKLIYTYYSPALDSLLYWFLQKSINLYGEAFAKTLAYEKTGFGSTDTAVNIIKQFWKKRGIENAALNIGDGSGLSPQNRVTTDAMVKALQYARNKSWFDTFYKALPVYNGMKMKSGTIGGVKAYAGYQTSTSGNEYTFAIIINNYNDIGGSISEKIFKVLNELK